MQRDAGTKLYVSQSTSKGCMVTSQALSSIRITRCYRNSDQRRVIRDKRSHGCEIITISRTPHARVTQYVLPVLLPPTTTTYLQTVICSSSNRYMQPGGCGAKPPRASLFVFADAASRLQVDQGGVRPVLQLLSNEFIFG